MSKNKYISFFDKYKQRNNKDNEYGETYNHMKEVYTKQLGIDVSKKYGETEYDEINENIKYEKIKVEGLLEKSKAVQSTVSGVVVPLAVVIFATEATFYQEWGVIGLVIFAILMLGTMFSQFTISQNRAKENHVYSTILKVLDDIEKEIVEGKLSSINQITQQEVAATKQKNKSDNRVKRKKK